MNKNTVKSFLTSRARVLLLIITSLSLTANAATIIVNGTDGVVNNADGLCSISEAIIAANTNTVKNECSAGNGTDIIELTTNIILTQQYIFEANYGSTGVPYIESRMTIDGKGFIIKRDSNLSCIINSTHTSDEFRIIRNKSSGNLSLRNVTIANGCVDSSGFSTRNNSAGGILNQGRLSLINTTLEFNQVRAQGAALFNDLGAVVSEISNSTFSNNSANERGGAIYNDSTITNIQNSTFSRNNGRVSGGAIYNRKSMPTIQNATFYENTSSDGNAIFIGSNSNPVFLKNSLFHSSNGKDCDDFSGGNFTGSSNISTQHFGGCPGVLSTNLSLLSIKPLADNGAPTKTHALTAWSQALDLSIDGTITDQRGKGVYKIRDLGAYEVQVEDICAFNATLISDGFTVSTNSASFLLSAMECAQINGTATDTIKLSGDIILSAPYNMVTGAQGDSGTPEISTPMIIDGQGFTLKRSTDLSCNLNGNHEAGEFRILYNKSSLTLQNITIDNGCADGTLEQGYGGGLFHGGVLTIINSIFSQNKSNIDGAGIYLQFGTLLGISDSIFSDNSTEGKGGAIKSGILINTIENTTFNNNFAALSGGGIYQESNAIINITNTDFLNNSTMGTGGAVASLSFIGGIVNSSFTNNSADISGGGIYNTNQEIDSISNSVFSNNSTLGSGGAIRNEDTLNLIKDTSFTDNTAATSGGAIDNQQTIIAIQDTLFANNNTDIRGGAIANDMIISQISNTTFSANSSMDNAGAVYNSGNINKIENNTFSGNTASNLGGAIMNDVGAVMANLKNTLFHTNNTDCSGVIIINGISNLSDNALSTCTGLIPPILSSATVKQLADNGGPTKTHGLQPGSQALDAAVGGTTTDQRGFSSNGIRDIGAYEAQSNELCSVDLQVNGFTTVVSNADELYTAINCSNANGNILDTINFNADITLMFDYENDANSGVTGTPGISTPLELNGQEFTLQRDNSTACSLDNTNDQGEFRLLHNHINNDLTIKNIRLNNGCADGPLTPNTFLSSGGALLNEGTLSIINTSFDQNQAGSGGAIYLSGGIVNEITNSTFSANTATNIGGAIYNSSLTNTITNNTFSGNTANNSFGGAIYVSAGKRISIILNNTFSNNSAPTGLGGAIYNDGDIFELRNSLFHNNSDSDCNTFTSGAFKNISTNSSGGCPGLLFTTLTATTLGPLASHGGFTHNHTLLAGSEAFNGAGGNFGNDQRGFTVLDNARDIGSIEDQPPVVTAPDDLTVEATGFMTNANLGMATVNDPDQADLIATANNTGPFQIGTNTITWLALDNHFREASDEQIVTVVDTTPPVITLLGYTTVILNIGDSYIDSGATATDIVFGNLTSSIMVVNNVNTMLAGNYVISYDVKDLFDNQATQVTRLVKVQASIGGNVSGLVNANTVTISDGTQSLVLGNGNYTFNTRIDSGTSYSVSIIAEPNDQSCTITNNTGTITDSNINNINITCGPQKYFIGGMASGLEIGNPIVLALDTELLTVSDNAAFVFLSPLLDAADYTVSINTLPINHTCDLVNPTGTIAMDDVTDVEVNCSKFEVIFIDGFED